MKQTKLWVLAAILVCGASVFTACSNDDKSTSGDLAEKIIGKWMAGTDVLAEYFVDGILLCTRWKKTADSEELREWWEIESIKDGVMKWTALRQREDGSTYTATFEMKKVE
ncbi:MAG: hypothetical protein IJ633_01925 [Prevotella sp.]|nr:hypothetical protein [Prevotella sp.]